MKYRGHHDPWLTDEIAELAAELECKTSSPSPRVLATRIATSETFGILPVAQHLAEKYNISILPPLRVNGTPHHRDIPAHALTRLSTKPVNRYQYLQRRQRSLHPVTPVHTLAEYVFFQKLINNPVFWRPKMKNTPAHEMYKAIDWEKLTPVWNAQVDIQDPTETDSNKRLYYKFHSHLERHHKRSLAWSSERTTIMMGPNALALKPLQDLLTKPVSVRPANAAFDAMALPELPSGKADLCYRDEGP
jgi:hypothetical protein